MWRCQECDETIETSLDVCWNCGTSRDGRCDAAIKPADDVTPSDTHQSKKPDELRAGRGVAALAMMLIAAGVVLILAWAIVVVVSLPPTHQQLAEQLVENDLKRFALLYHTFHSAHGKAPSSLADLESYTPEDPLGINSPKMYDAPRAIEMIRDGRFVVIWNAVLFSDSDENEKHVLGYESSASANGGLVMRAGGSVRHLSAEEFNALPMIKTAAE